MLMASQGASNTYEKASVVRGHHIYKVIWTPTVGEILQLRAEDDNEHDEHAVAVLKAGSTVGHVPYSMSRVCWFFLNRGGHMNCQITGHRKFGNGLEVPCVYTFLSSSARTITKLKTLLQDQPDVSAPEQLSCPH